MPNTIFDAKIRYREIYSEYLEKLISMEDIRKNFPVSQKCIYANTASSGLPYTDLMEWRQQHDRAFLNGGSMMRENANSLITETRNTVGRFFVCTYENVALLQNFSIGMNMLLEGLAKKERILFLKNDYPSLSWPFERRGFSISFAKMDENLERNILQKVAEEEITVLAISIIQWLNGIKFDLDFLKRLKVEYPHLLIIADGTQFCGTADFNFEESGIDVLGASCYKWLISGYGNGFMLFKDEVKERANIKTIGFNAANTDKSKKDKVKFAKQFEPGHLDTLNFGSLKFSLDFLKGLGKKNIEKKLEELSEKAKKEFSALDLLDNSVINRNLHSTIFNIKGDGALFKRLNDKKIICSQRGDGIRLSFHVYNTENEIDEIIKILKNEVKYFNS